MALVQIRRPLLAMATAALLIPCAAAADPVHTLVEGRVLLDSAPGPPAADDPRWQPAALPDRWRETRPGQGGFAWYRFAAPGPAPPAESWAVLLPRVNMNAAVFVNGQPVGSGGRFTEPVAHNFNRPLYFLFPSTLLSLAENVVDVRLFAYSFGQLAPVAIGPDAELRPRYQRLHFQQVRLAEIATVLSAVTVLFIGALWLGTRFDPVYGYFALATSFWTVTSLNYWVRDIPVAHWTWERLVNGGIEGFVIALAFWMHRFVDLSRPRIERGLAVYVAACLLLIALLPADRFYPAVNWIHASALLVCAYTFVEIGRHLRLFGRWEATAYVVGGALGLGMAANDLALQLGWRDADAPYLLAYMIPFVLLAFGTTLVARFVASLGRAEQLGRDLERRVQEKHAELEESYRRHGELERAHLLSHERERIMREMHDGLGGQLVSALAMVERGSTDPDALAGALRGALDDMRLVIDSLDPEVTGLGELLGMLRQRLEPLLRPNGVRFAWKVGELPAPPGWGAEEYLHVMRIVQEAVTNVVKHADAKVVTVSTARAADGIRIEIRDDGRGIEAGAGSGRGVPSMQRRARELGGELRVRPAHPGTSVELWLPLAPAGSASRPL